MDCPSKYGEHEKTKFVGGKCGLGSCTSNNLSKGAPRVPGSTSKVHVLIVQKWKVSSVVLTCEA